VAFKSNIHQKFAIMDQKVVWYGSINLLSYGSAQESIMRIESSNIANELMKSIERA
jgi:phosphatidylserine/phosphatidylglycerophosphate/cardiolipin synthase-like enzyme